MIECSLPDRLANELNALIKAQGDPEGNSDLKFHN
jgi:hypothetical protein